MLPTTTNGKARAKKTSSCWIIIILTFIVCLVVIIRPSNSSLQTNFKNLQLPRLPELLPERLGGSNGQLFSSTRIKEIARRLIESERNWRENLILRNEFLEKYGIDKLRKFGNGGGTYTLWDIFTPAFPCPLMERRMGRIGDGGKMVCGPEALSAYSPRALPKFKGKGAIIYSIGVEKESSFEAAVLTEFPGVEIFSYDLSVDHMGPQIMSSKQHYARTHFKKFGIATKDNITHSPPLYTLRTMMILNSHEWIDYLKIDLGADEVAEMDIVESFLRDFPDGLPFGQLSIEINVKDNKRTIKTLERWWSLLEHAGLRAFHHELNMPASATQGIYFSEYTFINIASTRSPFLGHPVAVKKSSA